MTCVTSGLVDHVNEDPAKVDRPAPERRDRGNLTERVAPFDRSAAAFARRRVEPDDPVDRVTRRQAHRVIGVIGAGHIPRCRHLGAEQSALERTVLRPGQVPDDPRDRHVRRGQQTGRGGPPRNIDKRGSCDRPVPVEPLQECSALILGLKISIRRTDDRHAPILPPSAHRWLEDLPPTAGSQMLSRSLPVRAVAPARQPNGRNPRRGLEHGRHRADTGTRPRTRRTSPRHS